VYPAVMPGTPAIGTAHMTVDVRYFSDDKCTQLDLSRFYRGNLKLFAGKQGRCTGITVRTVPSHWAHAGQCSSRNLADYSVANSSGASSCRTYASLG
jgi:hypothetical protein